MKTCANCGRDEHVTGAELSNENYVCGDCQSYQQGYEDGKGEAKNLIPMLKEEIGYTEDECETCKTCRYSKETQNKHVSNMWDWSCNILSKILEFSISPHGRCNNHEPKDKT